MGGIFNRFSGAKVSVIIQRAILLALKHVYYSKEFFVVDII